VTGDLLLPGLPTTCVSAATGLRFRALFLLILAHFLDRVARIVIEFCDFGVAWLIRSERTRIPHLIARVSFSS